MRLPLLTLLIISSFSLPHDAYQIFNPVKRPLLSFFVGPLYFPECLMNCTHDLQHALRNIILGPFNQEVKESFCSTFKKANDCVKASEDCNVPGTNYSSIFHKIVHGFNWACQLENEDDPFDNFYPCLNYMKNDNKTNEKCFGECGMKPSQFDLDFIDTPNVMTKLGDLCKPFYCFLECTREELNTYCPTSGTRIVNVMISAFDGLADEFHRSTPVEQETIKIGIPKQCMVYFSKKNLTELRYDNKFLTELFYMISAVRETSKPMAYAEAASIVLSVMKRLDQTREEEPVKELEWTAQPIMVLTAIISVMVINVIGLIFSIYWCLTATDDNGELGSSGMSVNFLEPNIRMKLKLPKLRNAAVTNCAEEVMELRIPRNGNQMPQNDEHQQTVVVSRGKRRRTFSVPMEPRIRTESTGSDNPAHLVIVRSNEL